MENEDGSSEYQIVVQDNEDIRKEISTTCAKLNIIILEMKRKEASLEDAFITMIQDRKEYSQKEIKKIQYNKEIQELREEKENKKMKKEQKKKEKEEKKAEKKAKKSNSDEKKKESKNNDKGGNK